MAAYTPVLRDRPIRVAFLDELRGLFILLMVFYHACYDLAEIFMPGMPFFYSFPMQFLQLVIAGDFVLISGAASRFSRNNLKRGLQVLGCGLVLTIATALFMRSQLVSFGVLHMLGICMILFALIQKALDLIHPTIGILLCTLLFMGTYFVSSGIIGFPPATAALPLSLYSTPFLFWLGFPGPGFFSSDYFPLLPWFFFFLAGTFVGVYLKEQRFPRWVYQSHAPWLAKVGRHTIWIYMLHQPILYGIFTLIFYFINRS